MLGFLDGLKYFLEANKRALKSSNLWALIIITALLNMALVYLDFTDYGISLPKDNSFSFLSSVISGLFNIIINLISICASAVAIYYTALPKQTAAPLVDC